MSHNKIKVESKELFLDLSEPDQEKISGGSLAFFLQLTKETSFAKNLINVANNNQNISINQVAGSSFSQLTIAADSSLFNTGNRQTRERGFNNFLRFLQWLLN